MKKLVKEFLIFFLCITIILFSFNSLSCSAEELKGLETEETEDILINDEQNDKNLDNDLEIDFFENDNLLFQQSNENLEEVDLSVGAANGITTAAIDNICKKYGYANGKYWTYNGNANKTKYTASTTPAGTNGYKGYSYPLDKGWQCWAFARYLMTQVTGEYVGEGKWQKITAGNVTSLQVGDVVCVGDSVHTAVVYKDLGGGKFQFIEVWGSYGNKIVIGGYNGSSDRNTLAKIKSYGLQYVYRWNGTINSTLTINNHNSVGTLTSGGNYTPNGVVKSNYALNYVNAYILKSDGNTIVNAGYSHQLSNTYSYTLKNSTIMNELKFNSLAAGTYYFKVTSQDSSGLAKNLVYEKFEVKTKGNDPIGYFDSAIAHRVGRFRVTGWAYDPDDTGKALDIHIYVGGPAGSSNVKYFTSIKADKKRDDVNKAYGAGSYHGYDEEIVRYLSPGYYKVYIYAINVGGGNTNTLLGIKEIYMTNDANTLNGPGENCTPKLTRRYEPSCTDFGTEWYECPVCKGTWHTIIPAKGHDMTYVKAVAATCESKGNVAYYSCKECGKYFSDSSGNNQISDISVSATGHSWDNGTVTKKATATENGEKTYKCINCSKTKTEVISATCEVPDNTKTSEDVNKSNENTISKDENNSSYDEKKTTDDILNYDNNISDKTDLNPQEMTQEVIQETKKDSDGTISTTGIYCSSTNPSIVAGMVTEQSNPEDVVEYKWLVCEESEGIWTEISPWTQNNEWLDWKPVKSGNYIFVCQARVVGNEDASLISASFGTPYIKNDGIMEICQMPYWGEGGGYLIGFESFDNPNQEYQYEMFVMDLSLYSSGAPIPWVYRTGAITLTEGKTLWTIWQPEYGYYLTLFRLYDKDGRIIDEVCYGFANAY